MRILALALIALVFCMVVDRHPDPPGIVRARSLDAGVHNTHPPVTPAVTLVSSPQLVFVALADVCTEHSGQTCANLWSMAADSSPPA